MKTSRPRCKQALHINELYSIANLSEGETLQRDSSQSDKVPVLCLETHSLATFCAKR